MMLHCAALAHRQDGSDRSDSFFRTLADLVIRCAGSEAPLSLPDVGGPGGRRRHGYTKEHLQSVSLEEVCAAVAVSERTLRRSFRSEGRPVLAHLSAARPDAAGDGLRPRPRRPCGRPPPQWVSTVWARSPGRSLGSVARRRQPTVVGSTRRPAERSGGGRASAGGAATAHDGLERQRQRVTPRTDPAGLVDAMSPLCQPRASRARTRRRVLIVTCCSAASKHQAWRPGNLQTGALTCAFAGSTGGRSQVTKLIRSAAGVTGLARRVPGAVRQRRSPPPTTMRDRRTPTRLGRSAKALPESGHRGVRGQCARAGRRVS